MWSLCFALLGLSSVSAPSAPRLTQVTEAFGALELGPETRRVERLELRSGHLRLELGPGAATPVLAGGRSVGLYYRGRGRMRYHSDERLEREVMRYNIDETSSLEVAETDAELVVEDRFDELLWLAAGQPVPELEGPPTASLAKPFDRHRQRFHERIYWSPPQQLFALQAIDAPEARVVWAELRGGEEDLLYVHDGVRQRSESLLLVEKARARDRELRKWLWTTLLSTQPIERDARNAQPPRVSLRHIDVELTGHNERSAQIIARETLVAEDRPRRLVDLSLYSQNYDISRIGALQRRELAITRLHDAQGQPLAFHHVQDHLLIELAAPSGVGEPFEIELELEGDILARGGDNYWVLSAEPWFPQPHELSGHAYTLRFKVKVKPPFVPFASGVERLREADDEWHTLETSWQEPTQFAAIAAGKYRSHETTQDGLTVRVASYVHKNQRAVDRLTELTREIVTRLSQLLGPFPFPELNIIQLNTLGWAQAPPGVIFITKEAFTRFDEASRRLGRTVDRRFAHELAHQYWGHVVKMPGLEEQWLTESFADYSAGLFFRDYRKRTWDSMLRHWKQRSRRCHEVASIPRASQVRDRDRKTGERHRTGLLYHKGPYLLWTIHQRIGDELFFELLKTYRETHDGTFGSTPDLIALLGRLTGEDWTDFFEEHYWGTGLPTEP